MSRAGLDRLLRGVALVAALAVVIIATLNPQLRLNSDAAARSPDSVSAAIEHQRQSADARTKGYAYLLRAPDRRFPARWCPGVIGYSLDLSQLEAAGLDAQEETDRWRRVFDEWSRQSGGQYVFEFRGLHELRARGDGQLDLESIQPGTIGITYVHGDPSEELGGYQAAAVRGRTAGNGGLQVRSSGGMDASALIGDRGFVMIDVTDAAKLAGDGLRRTLYQHESGHALGLGHVEDESALMHGTLSSARMQVGPGDAAGLMSLTRMPCEG